MAPPHPESLGTKKGKGKKKLVRILGIYIINLGKLQ